MMDRLQRTVSRLFRELYITPDLSGQEPPPDALLINPSGRLKLFVERVVSVQLPYRFHPSFCTGALCPEFRVDGETAWRVQAEADGETLGYFLPERRTLLTTNWLFGLGFEGDEVILYRVLQAVVERIFVEMRNRQGQRR